MASACRAMCGDMATGPVGQPAGSSPLVVGHQDRVAQQTLRGGPDQPCAASRAAVWPEMQRRSCPYRSARPKGAGGLNAIPFQLCVSAGTYDVLRDRPSRRSGCASSTTCKTFHSICHDALIVFTGLSGSGKSSLAFDTIFAEGQRRYVESLSAYARQFLGQMDKPDVDFIEGLSPAVSIDQKSTSRNPRSTVGTITEVYDYLRLLYARAGRPHCPICGEPISRQSPQQIVDRLMAMEEGTRFQVLAPVVRGRKGEYVEVFRELASEGFSRARVDAGHPTHRYAHP